MASITINSIKVMRDLLIGRKAGCFVNDRVNQPHTDVYKPSANPFEPSQR